MASLHGLFEEAVDRANQALSTHAASSHLPVPSDVDAALQLLRQFVSDVQEMCRSSWTQFDVRLIAWGCIGFLLCTFMAIRGLPQTHSLLTLRAVAMASLASSVHVVMFGSASNEPLTRMLTSPSQAPLGIVLVICWCGLVLNGTAPVALPSLPIGLLFLMRLLGLTSNSFVVEERWVLMFLLSSALLVS